MMIAREAMSVRVIGERFDNATVGDLTATADFDHAFHFKLQRRQSSDALVDFVEVRARNRGHCITGLGWKRRQPQEVADRVLAEP